MRNLQKADPYLGFHGDASSHAPAADPWSRSWNHGRGSAGGADQEAQEEEDLSLAYPPSPWLSAWDDVQGDQEAEAEAEEEEEEEEEEEAEEEADASLAYAGSVEGEGEEEEEEELKDVAIAYLNSSMALMQQQRLQQFRLNMARQQAQFIMGLGSSLSKLA
jgi:hypothetical protein